ncbi:hypothetical protein GGF37_002905 [Kickxella alabastrina]|nr:hypothetical protein GGF37_002905 [Kickxella alabastrina]
MSFAHHWLFKRNDTSEILADGTLARPSKNNELQRSVYLWIGVIDIFIFSVSTMLFIYRGRRTLDINAHAVLLTSIGSFTILIVNSCFLFQFVWPGNFPCFIILWCAYPGVMLWMSCTMARAMRLYILSFRNIQKLKERNKAGQMTAAQLYGKGVLMDSGSNVDPNEISNNQEQRNMTFFQTRVFAVHKWWSQKKVRITERHLVYYTMGVTMFAAIICSVIQGLTKNLSIVPMKYARCAVGVWEYFPLYAMTAVYCIVFTPIIVYNIWPIKDAFGIRHDILLNNLFTFVCIAMFMVQTNKGFGGQDPFWDSFLWCALLFNMSQFTSVIFPLIRSYRQSDIFTWSDNSGRAASKELFYRVLNHPELFEKLKIYSAANFCTEVTLFLEEYQVLKANTVRFYNIDEPTFGNDDNTNGANNDDDDIGNAADSHMGGEGASSRPNLATVGNSANAWAAAAAMSPSHTSKNDSTVGVCSSRAPAYSEKDALRLHLNGTNRSSPIAADLLSNPDTITSLSDGASMSEIDYSDKAAMMGGSPTYHSNNEMGFANGGHTLSSQSGQQQHQHMAGNNSDACIGVNMHGMSDGASPSTAPFGSGSPKFAGILRMFGRSAPTTLDAGDNSQCNADFYKPSNIATLAVGGTVIGNLPERRNSRGEDIMVISRIPPFTPVRYTVISTLVETPAGLNRLGNMETFKTLPFALRGDYYGFYSTFIADGATLQINLIGRISESITRLIHSQQYTVDMMDEAHTEVLQLLYDNIFKKFVRQYHRDMASIM